MSPTSERSMPDFSSKDDSAESELIEAERYILTCNWVAVAKHAENALARVESGDRVDGTLLVRLEHLLTEFTEMSSDCKQRINEVIRRIREIQQ